MKNEKRKKKKKKSTYPPQASTWGGRDVGWARAADVFYTLESIAIPIHAEEAGTAGDVRDVGHGAEVVSIANARRKR